MSLRLNSRFAMRTILFTLLLSAASAAFASNLTIDDVLQSASQFAQNPAPAKETQVSAYMLVSLSMPKASLERLARDCRDAGVPMAFAGVPSDDENPKAPLLNPNSLKAFAPLIEAGAPIELHPELFTEFGIKEVPVLLIKEETDSACGTAPRAVAVPGDVTLGYALDQLSDRQDVFGEKARALRAKLGDRN